jgi:hypothetical protein
MIEVDLSSFVHQGKDPWYSQPFSLVPYSGQVWDVATDRAMLIGIRRRAKYPRFKGPGAELSQMLSWLRGVAETPHEIEVADLLRWIGPSPNGCGVILGVSVDLVRLAKLLGVSPLKKVHMWGASKLVGDPRCLAFEVKDRWRALLMGHDAVDEGLPVLDLGVAEAVPFDDV